MSEVIKLKKGFDINLAGKAQKNLVKDRLPETFALKPTDFVGMYRPKLLVKEGDTVKAGTPIFYDKGLDQVMYTAPVSGEVAAVVRGAKRKLLEVRILADKEIEYEPFEKFTVSELKNVNREEAQATMIKSGVWPNIIQRPFAVVANPEDTPKAIFISSFDTSPLAPNYDFIFKGQEKYLQAGIDILSNFTDGTIHVNMDGDGEVSSVFSHLKGVKLNQFKGPHPSGNVGVQIHHLDPIQKGQMVWTINPYGVIQIGKLFLEGVYDASKVVAVAGSSVKNPQYYQTFLGACVDKFLEGNLEDEHVRVISGNVLTGEKIEEKGYLGYYDHLLTVIPEGDKPRFFATDGWLAPTKKRLSFHRALGLLSFLNGKDKEYELDSSTNGEERAFVMTGAFEKVVPMDVLPTHLIKAVMAEDYDEMEALGILEVAEEDLALCEFIDVSKHDVQSILRKGINMVREG